MIGQNWGASTRDRALALPCDDLRPDASLRLHRAVSVDAPVSIVFSWLCQLRIAPYSYDLLDNRGRRSPRELVPGLDRLAVGQRFMSIFELTSFATDEHLTLRNRRAAVTYVLLADGAATRLVVRVLLDPPGGRVGSALVGRLAALGDLVMMRRQLHTLAALAERDARAEP